MDIFQGCKDNDAAEHATPYDYDGYGTRVMGVMVGGDATGTAIGVAHSKFQQPRAFRLRRQHLSGSSRPRC